MATQTIERPQRDLAWVAGESRPVALLAGALGALALAVLIFGAVAVLVGHGLVPVENVIRGLRSNEMTGVGVFALLLGLAAMLIGWGTYKSMPTKISREEAVGGAVLGLQAALLGGALLWFSESDVDRFATSYLNFEGVLPYWDAFVNGAKNTLVLAISGEFFGVVLGLILAVFAISKRAVVRAPARVYINFFRATPLVWQIIFIGLGVPIGLGIEIQPYTAAIMALSLNTAAYAAEVFRAGIRSIERGQLEAARGLGMSYMQSMRYAVIPQAVRRVIPPLMNEFVILIKDTSLVIVLGLSVNQFELMSVGNNGVENTYNMTFLIGTALGYLAITLPSIRVVNILERRLRSGLVGVGA